MSASDIDFKKLAAEREERLRATGADPRAAPPAAKPAPRAQPRPAAAASLAKAHRSIRIAHSIALTTMTLCLVLLLFFGWSSTYLIIFALAAGLARSGGGMLHGMLPQNLQEGQAPTPAEVDAAPKGLFCPDGLRDFSNSLGSEYSVLVENLAFACTYGKRNCLTNDMYTGNLSLGKVLGLVWGKVSQGVLRCD